MLRLDRLGIMVSLVILGLLLSILVPLPSRGFGLTLLGSELHLVLSGPLLLAVVLAALVCAGVDSIVLEQFPEHLPLAHRLPLWMLPVSLVVVGLTALQGLWWGYQVVVIGATGLLLAVTLVMQYHSLRPRDGLERAARIVLNVLTYAMALVFFVLIYGAHLRSLISATAALLCSAALALELLRVRPEKILSTWLYAAVLGLMLGEFTWSLNYYHALDARLGGALLLLIFYATSGIAQQHLWGRLTRRVAIEFALVGAASLVVLGSISFA